MHGYCTWTLIKIFQEIPLALKRRAVVITNDGGIFPVPDNQIQICGQIDVPETIIRFLISFEG